LAKSLVDILWALELVASRAAYGGSDFILAGPLNLWFRRVLRRPQPYLVLVASEEGAPRLEEVLRIGAEEVLWEEWWEGVGGRRFRLRLRGMEIAGLADPVLRVGGEPVRFRARDLSRETGFVVLGSRVVRLAPLGFEAALWESLGGRAAWRVEGLGGAANP
jgi:hypothetical protein